MGSDYSEVEIQIPYFDLKKELPESKQENEEWKKLCGKVREACEEYGCFMVGYDGFPTELHEKIFMAMKDLFDLPFETKQKNSNTRQFRGYIPSSDSRPLYESLCVEDAAILDAAQAFTDLMWPLGNPAFCQTINSMSRKMDELKLVILRMILESYDVPTYFDVLAENTHSFLRTAKYKPPQASNEAAPALIAHTDKGFLTILCADQAVKGFELLTKQGHWLQLSPLQGSFLVIIGDSFKAWSNGRLHAVEHKVVMRGDKERYSCIFFIEPKDGEVVEVAKELVDDDHPLLFKPFKFIDFWNYSISTNKVNKLEMYAGV